MCIKSLLDDKLSDWSKLKTLADYKINVSEKINFASGKVENDDGKGDNAGY